MRTWLVVLLVMVALASCARSGYVGDGMTEQERRKACEADQLWKRLFFGGYGQYLAMLRQFANTTSGRVQMRDGDGIETKAPAQ